VRAEDDNRRRPVESGTHDERTLGSLGVRSWRAFRLIGRVPSIIGLSAVGNLRDHGVIEKESEGRLFVEALTQLGVDESRPGLNAAELDEGRAASRSAVLQSAVSAMGEDDGGRRGSWRAAAPSRMTREMRTSS